MSTNGTLLNAIMRRIRVVDDTPGFTKRETPLDYIKHEKLTDLSIEGHSPEINVRTEPGHHEMNLVVTARGGKKALLILTA